jgi:hypothetical protein
VELAGQGGGQVEAEAVDVHLGHPVAEGVHDQLQHLRVDGIKGIAGAGVIHVEARVFRDKAVVAVVVDTAEGEGGTEMVALGGVVVDHIQDHLDAGGVQRLDHLLELGDLAAGLPRAGIARLRGKEVDGVVSPVVA